MASSTIKYQNVLKDYGTLTDTDDLDNITEQGIYHLMNLPAHAPTGTAWCTLEVYKRNDTNIFQIIHGNDRLWQRAGSSNSMGTWYKFTGEAVN